jgi:hypothetical protein
MEGATIHVKGAHAPASIDFAQITIGDANRLRLGDWMPAANHARPPLEPNGAAFRAGRQNGRAIFAPAAMHWIFRSSIRVQGPDNWLFHKAVLEHGAGMV